MTAHVCPRRHWPWNRALAWLGWRVFSRAWDRWGWRWAWRVHHVLVDRVIHARHVWGCRCVTCVEDAKS